MYFEILENNYAIYRFGTGSELPEWVYLSANATDYFLIKQKDLVIGIQALIENDHIVTIETIKASE